MKPKADPPATDATSLNLDEAPKAIKPPPPLVIDQTIMDDAEAQRKEDYDKKYHWKRPGKDGKLEEYELFDYSLGREQTYHRLVAFDVPIPLASEVRSIDTLSASAIKILFLCSHKPEEYGHLRPDPARFMEAIEAWAETHCPREVLAEATALGIRIHNSKNQFLAVPRPSDRKVDSGN